MITIQLLLELTKGAVRFSCSDMPASATPWTAARQAPLSITNSWNVLKLRSIELVMPSNHFMQG